METSNGCAGWRTTFRARGNDVGMSSSPLFVGDIVVAQVECQGDSFATGIDKQTGESRWRIARPRASGWTSPVVFHNAAQNRDELLLQSGAQLTAHDPQTGKELWAYKVPCDAISSAVVGDGLVFVPSKGITALRPNATEEPTIVWNVAGLQPGAASTLFDRGRLIMINRSGVLASADAADGRSLFKIRMEGEFWGTPAMAGNRVYSISQAGVGYVVETSADGRQGKLIATNHLEGTFQSSPAISSGACSCVATDTCSRLRPRSQRADLDATCIQRSRFARSVLPSMRRCDLPARRA